MPGRKLSFECIVVLAIFAMTTLLTGRRATAQTESVLHNFDKNGQDGYAPNFGLISDAEGNLYGTTATGGTGSCTPEYGNIPTPCGTVFELSPQSGGGWTEKVLYSFHGVDGYNPAGLALDAMGNLYGTTTWGGTGSCVPFKQSNPMGCGVVFELTPAAGGGWTQKVLLDFKVDGSGGTGPSAGLVLDAAGNLYGTTAVGGAHGYGTVFELSPTSGGNWSETVLYSFNYENGSRPDSTLVFFGGNLYGTTANGGRRPYDGGTVFELTPKTGGGWAEKVLHSFCSQVHCSDGYYPTGNLIVDAAGNLYGTTAYGGNNVSCEQGTTYICGMAFELTHNPDGTWTEKVLHDFGAHGDGAYPSGGLVFDGAGNLYGSTFQGGSDGSGTVFEMSPQGDGSWSESVLYSFHPGKVNDGGIPVGSLVIDASENLYGATDTGGTYYDGTVFEIRR